VEIATLMPAMRGVMHVPDPCATFRFSTAGLPEPARAEAVRDLHLRERTMLPSGLEPIEPIVPLPDRPLHVDVIKRTLPGLAVVSGTLSGVCHAPRPKGTAGQGEGDLLLAVNVWGSSLARQRDTELSLRDGDAIFWTRGVVGLGIMRFTPAGFLGCRVARAEVAALLGRLDDTPMCFVPRDTEALRLLVTYARGIAESVPLATPELQRLAVSHTQDLMAAIVAAARGGRAIAEGRGIAAARLRAIMIDVRAHLGGGDLSVAAVAQRQRMTPRYVHKLFENEGFTFSSFVRDQRLACAHRMLTDPRLAYRTISAIAFDVGFGDLSYFNRTFRRRYGVTPGEIKQSALKAGHCCTVGQSARGAGT
jgi:AraC-like DNA-binding protein